MTGTEEEYKVRRLALKKAWWHGSIKVPVGKRILVICPHPDDESIGAGGLLLAHREASEIHLLCVCDGSKGGELESMPWTDSEPYKAELVSVRKGEFRKVAGLLGAGSCTFLDCPDGEVFPHSEIARRLREEVERIKPDVVLLPWLFDNLQDHRMTNVIYAWGCSDLHCSVFAYEVWTPLEPNAIFDFSDNFEEKMNLIRIYESQLRTVDYISYAAALARMRAFHYPVEERRSGAVEGYLALPNEDYCGLVNHFYGKPGCVNEAALPLLGKEL